MDWDEAAMERVGVGVGEERKVREFGREELRWRVREVRGRRGAL